MFFKEVLANIQDYQEQEELQVEQEEKRDMVNKKNEHLLASEKEQYEAKIRPNPLKKKNR
jgi:hypothetical protein